MRKVTEADSADLELPVVSMWSAAELTTVVTTSLILWFSLLLDYQAFFCQIYCLQIEILFIFLLTIRGKESQTSSGVLTIRPSTNYQ
jgi:hypothetical protein